MGICKTCRGFYYFVNKCVTGTKSIAAPLCSALHRGKLISHIRIVSAVSQWEGLPVEYSHFVNLVSHRSRFYFDCSSRLAKFSEQFLANVYFDASCLLFFLPLFITVKPCVCQVRTLYYPFQEKTCGGTHPVRFVQVKRPPCYISNKKRCDRV